MKTQDFTGRNTGRTSIQTGSSMKKGNLQSVEEKSTGCEAKDMKLKLDIKLKIGLVWYGAKDMDPFNIMYHNKHQHYVR